MQYSRIITGKELMRKGYRLLYPEPILPPSLEDAAGMLQDRYEDMRKHYRKIRKEWAQS